MEYGRLVLTPAARCFMQEWLSDSPVVKAHTSGSTGTPKEIHLLKEDMLASARATIRFFNLDSDSLLHLPLSPSYIAGKMQIVRALTAGCRLVVEEPSSRPLATGTCDRITLLPIVPSQLEGLLDSSHIAKIENLIIGGAPLSPADEQTLLRTGINAYATYGMTETCSHVALRRIGSPSFQALPGFTFTTDPRGCLGISSDSMSFRRLVTNDMVRLTSPTSFEWLGRYDNVINSGGVKIHPEEIERILLPLLPSGATAYVTSRRSSRWGEEAVIVTDSPAVGHALLEKLRALVPRHHCPKDIILLPEIPRTAVSGKIKREKF